MRLICLVSVIGLFALKAQGQIQAEILLEQNQFLRDESMQVKVRIVNRSGRTLNFGEEKDWLTFNIENRDDAVISKYGDAPVQGEFSLESSMQAMRRVDLMPYFDLSMPGRYRVTATIKVKDWPTPISTPPKQFDVVRGTKLWEQEFGVPSAEGVVEVRKFALQQAQYMSKVQLYVRLTDLSENKVFKVFPVGQLVSFSRPEPQLDKQSHLHLLFQTGARAFAYIVVSPHGDITTRQTHEYAGSRPALQRNESGVIFVSGGARRISAADLPPPFTGNERPNAVR